jgi:hypothetical protein
MAMIPPPANGASTIESTFEAGVDGWNVVDVASPNYATVLATYLPVWHASGGDANTAFIDIHDPTGEWIFFNAPAKFLGDKSQYVGGTLEFTLRCNHDNYRNDSVVVLIGAGRILVCEIDVPLINQWTHLPGGAPKPAR